MNWSIIAAILDEYSDKGDVYSLLPLVSSGVKYDAVDCNSRHLGDPHDDCETCGGSGQVDVTDKHILDARQWLNTTPTTISDLLGTSSSRPDSNKLFQGVYRAMNYGKVRQRFDSDPETASAAMDTIEEGLNYTGPVTTPESPTQVTGSIQKEAMWYYLKPRWIVRRKFNAAIRRKVKSVFSPVGLKVGSVEDSEDTDSE